MKILAPMAFACLAGLCLIGSAEAMPVASQPVVAVTAAPVQPLHGQDALIVVRRRPVVRVVRRRPVVRVIRRVIR